MEIAKTVFGGRSTDGYSDKANKGGFSRDIKISWSRSWWADTDVIFQQFFPKSTILTRDNILMNISYIYTDFKRVYFLSFKCRYVLVTMLVLRTSIIRIDINNPDMYCFLFSFECTLNLEEGFFCIAIEIHAFLQFCIYLSY